ncbi:hypothetical protein [Intestinibacter sp.]|uniref:hypothetical protein n=1 Tax=Intestinibacter sp. TaxID=1965304 RepID=UPI003F18D4C7
MNKVIEIIDTLENWDLIRTDKGSVGLFFDDAIHSHDTISMGDNVAEIKHGVVDLNVIWNTAPENDTVFIGVSYEADIKDYHKVIQYYEDDDINIVEYDQFSPVELNNKKLVEATEHVIVPPSDFWDNHIIGKGLFNQIQERAKAGKTSNIFVNGDVVPVKAVYELKGDDYTKAAVVIF